MDNEDVFGMRCRENPQGVISDLVKQTTLQGKEIYDLNNEIVRLQGIMKDAGFDPALIITPPKKKTRAKKEKI